MRIRRLIYCLIVMVFLAGFSVIYASSGRAPIQGEAIDREKAKFYVVGMGTGEADLITLRAIDYIKRADVVICGESTAKKFGKYLESKKILSLPMFPYWECLRGNVRNRHTKTKSGARNLFTREKKEQV